MTSLRTDPVPPEHAADGVCTLEQEAFGNLVRAYDCLWSEKAKFFQSFDITPQQ
jgi:hypothetical protein